MMRVKLNLFCDGEDCKIPFNYNYFLASSIYSVIKTVDSSLSDYLHNSKDIKPYTFSNILIDDKEVVDDGIIVNGDCSLIFSTLDEEIFEACVRGFLYDIDLRVKDVVFSIDSIEKIESEDFEDDGEYKFETLSPVNISIKKDDKIWDLYPDDEKFCLKIIKNLIYKYNYFYDEDIKLENIDFKLNLNNGFKNKRIKIKNTYHRASMFDFLVKGDCRLIKIMYDNGLGNKNAQGFGCVRLKGD